MATRKTKEPVQKKKSVTTMAASARTMEATKEVKMETILGGASMDASQVEEKVAQTVKEVTQKATRQAAEKTQKAAEKTVEQTVEKSVEKTSPKVETSKEVASPVAKKEIQEEIFVQFLGKEISAKEIQEQARKAWTQEYGKKEEEITSIRLYFRTEVSKCYYVVNDEFNGCVEL